MYVDFAVASLRLICIGLLMGLLTMMFFLSSFTRLPESCLAIWELRLMRHDNLSCKRAGTCTCHLLLRGKGTCIHKP